MKRMILYVAGMLMSAGGGLAAYFYSGLADAFESEVVSYAIGFAIAVVFASVFRSGYLNGREALTEETTEEERMILCSECRSKFEPNYSPKKSSSRLALSQPKASCSVAMR